GARRAEGGRSRQAGRFIRFGRVCEGGLGHLLTSVGRGNGDQYGARRNARKTERGTARRSLADQDQAERSGGIAESTFGLRLSNIYRSGKVVAVSPEIT